MKNTITLHVVILLSVLLALVTVMSTCASVPENLISAPRVEIKNVQVMGLRFQSQAFLLSFDVENLNPFPLPIRSVDCGINLDGQRFANSETVSDVKLPADGEVRFSISVELNLL